MLPHVALTDQPLQLSPGYLLQQLALVDIADSEGLVYLLYFCECPFFEGRKVLTLAVDLLLL